MSVTNDPNYHEGQPVFGPTDAVRPTGETGTRCPWCQEAVDTITRLNDGKREYHTAWRCRCFVGWHDSPESALSSLVAARPLPDFPAGKSEDEGWISNAISKIPKRYILCPTCGEKNRIIVCVNLCGLPTAPARPAAAGLTLTDEERDRAFAAGMREAGKCGAEDDVDRPYCLSHLCDAVHAAISHAESLLSSRATGAEVEIPTWTDDDFCKSLCEHMGSLSLEGYDPIHRRGMRYGFAAGIKWAREQYAHRQVEIVIEEPSGDWISNQWSASIKEAAVDPNGGNDVYRFYRRVLDYARRHATIRGKP